MIIKRREIIENLPKKGFEKENTHHIYFHHKYKGKRTGIYTYVSHGSNFRDISDPLLSFMKKQLKLNSLNELINLIKCPLNGDDYNKILKDKKLI